MSPLQIRILLHYYAIVGDYKGNTPDNLSMNWARWIC